MHAVNSPIHLIIEMNPKTNTKIARGGKGTKTKTTGKTKQKLVERWEKQNRKNVPEPTNKMDKTRQKETREADDKDRRRRRRRRSPAKPEEARRRRQVENKKRRNGHGFQNFSQKDARSPHKKVKGYSATLTNDEDSCWGGEQKRGPGGAGRKEPTFENILRARKL